MLRQSLLVIVTSLVVSCNSEVASRSGQELISSATESSATAAGTARRATAQARRAELERRLEHQGADLPRQRLRAEVTRIPLQRRFGHATAARRNAQGQLEYGCFDRADHSVRFLDSTRNEVAR